MNENKCERPTSNIQRPVCANTHLPVKPLSRAVSPNPRNTAPGGAVKVECILHDETIWLTQDRIAELFGVQRPAITKHLKNIFESGELEEKVVSSILEQKRYQSYYFSICFRIQSAHRQRQPHSYSLCLIIQQRFKFMLASCHSRLKNQY